MKFEVLNIKKSEKAGCVDVKINHEAKGIVVIKERRVYNESYTNYKKFIIDGFKVVFNKNFEVVSIEQQYEVTGKKHRFNKTEKGETGMNALCEGYRYFYSHVAPYMEKMKQLILEKQAPAAIIPWARLK